MAFATLMMGPWRSLLSVEPWVTIGDTKSFSGATNGCTTGRHQARGDDRAASGGIFAAALFVCRAFKKARLLIKLISHLPTSLGGNITSIRQSVHQKLG